MTRPAHSFVNLREIRHDVLCLAAFSNPKRREYRAVIKAGSVSFDLMSEGEQEIVLESFRTFLMRLSTDTVIHIRIKPYNLTSYLEKISLAQPQEGLAELAADHQQFVRSFAAAHVLLQREFYLIVKADEPLPNAKDDFEAAKSQLDMRCTDIVKDLERIGIVGYRLKQEELANYYLSVFNAQYAARYPLDSLALETTGLPVAASHNGASPATDPLPEEEPETQQLIKTMQRSPHKGIALAGRLLALQERSIRKRQQRKQHAAASSTEGGIVQLAELVQPASIEVQRTYLRVNNHFDEYLRFLAVIGYPRQVISGWLERLLLDEPYIDLCLHICPMDAAAYIQKLSRKLVAFTGTQRVAVQRGRSLDPFIANAMKDVEELRDKLVRQEEQVFGFALYIMVRADSKKALEARTNRLYSQLRSLNLQAIPLTMRHHKGLQAFLPGRDPLKLRRILDTSSIVTAFPFVDNTLTTDGGIVRGVTPNRSLVILNPFEKAFENAHECAVGPSGTGKSLNVKVKILRSILTGVKACVLDPEGEFVPLAEHVHGRIVQLSSGSLQVNPFRLFLSGSGEDTAILEEKIQALLVLFDLLLAEKGETLRQEEKALLSRCLAYCYQEDTNIYPCMQEFYEVLRSGICGPDLFHLAERLERFLPMFPRVEAEEITLDTPLLLFNMRDLEDDLRDVATFLVTMAVWARIRKQAPSQRTPRLLVIDETWRFLRLDTSAQFLVNIIRLARKHYLGVCTNIHDANEFFESEWGRAIWTNSAIKFVLKQSSSTIDSIADMLKLSAGERRYLTTCGVGEGLLCAKGLRVPMRVIVSDLEYALSNTNPQELSQAGEMQPAQGHAPTTIV
jgi:hypothetical protein